MRWRQKGQMLRAANDRYTQDASSAIGGGIGCGWQQDGQGLRAAVYLLDGGADGRVADVGVDLHKEGATCATRYTSAQLDSGFPLHAGKYSAGGLLKVSMKLWPEQSHRLPAVRM